MANEDPCEPTGDRRTAAVTLSVCIPAYNRAAVLLPLLESILSQDYDRFEIVIGEDASPERDDIRALVQAVSARHPGRIDYFENEDNLGYDGNLRRVIERARGEYCVLMGNDDLMCPGALSTIAAAVARYDRIGVVLRTYASFDGAPDRIEQVFRYFEGERLFPAGARTIVTFFRRSVVLPGMVLHREMAVRYATDRFDGSLLYQLYLVGRTLETMQGVFLPQVLALYRNGGVPDFGNSAAEQGHFVPRTITPGASLHFMAGMLRVARQLEVESGLPVYEPILRDLSNYSYPFLAIQARRSLGVYVGYCWALARLGFGRYPLFYLYLTSLLVLGKRGTDALIRAIKKARGHTPVIGDIYQGQPG